jgi:hypothetical protein
MDKFNTVSNHSCRYGSILLSCSTFQVASAWFRGKHAAGCCERKAHLGHKTFKIHLPEESEPERQNTAMLERYGVLLEE